MVNQLLKIRGKQLTRLIVEIGVFRTVFLTCLVCFALFAIFMNLEEHSSGKVTLSLFSLLILAIHFYRKDKTFIKTVADRPKVIFFIEYTLLSLPILSMLIYYQYWSFILFFVLTLSAVPFFNIKSKIYDRNPYLQKLIPNCNFEWKAGMRTSLFFIVPLWFIGIFTSFVTASVPIVIFIISIIIFGFYEKAEPLPILLANELDSKTFLKQKVKNHLFSFSLVLLPLILAFLIFNIQYYYIVLIEFVFFSTILTYTILLKYAFYRPNSQLKAAQIFTMLGVLSIFIPFLLPVIIILIIKFLFQAIHNLTFYLDDYN